MSEIISRYLRHHAESEAHALFTKDSLKFDVFDAVLVVPMSGEGPSFQRLLRSIPREGHNILVIIVINASSETSHDDAVANAMCMQWIQDNYKRSRLRAGPSVLETALKHLMIFDAPWGALWCLRRTENDLLFLPKDGVGRARKIGADMALALFQRGLLRRRWIHTTDADVVLPSDYFAQTAVCEASVALAIYDFVHVESDDRLAFEATQLYEKSLHLYVEGLETARSPYAFHTMGSLFAMDAHHYAAVRGFPRRAAGEDFYLANKMAKVGRVHSLKGKRVMISARRSHRVPFGTGASTQEIIKHISAGLPLPSRYHYPAMCFERLGAFLHLCTKLVCGGAGAGDLVGAIKQSDELSACFEEDMLRRFEHNLSRALKSTHRAPARVKLAAFHSYFDALRTLQWIHHVRTVVH